jgi:hypothetical protein
MVYGAVTMLSYVIIMNNLSTVPILNDLIFVFNMISKKPRPFWTSKIVMTSNLINNMPPQRGFLIEV